MNDRLLETDLDETAVLWRTYWAQQWNRLPRWSDQRLNAFMRADEGRRTAFLPKINPEDASEALRLWTAPVVRDDLNGKGCFLGVLTHPTESSGVIQFEEPGHLLTVAPTRSGKGTGHIIPNLLTYAGSAVVLDIKGENFALTARARESMFDRAEVKRFAPFEDNTDRYNPLDFVRSGENGGAVDETYDDARLIAEMLVPGGRSSEAYWEIEARNIITMLVMYVAISQDRKSTCRNMAEVARLLFHSVKRNNESEGSAAEGLLETVDTIHEFAQANHCAPLKSLAAGFRDHDTKLRSNIVSSCRADMIIWTSPRLQNATASSDIWFEQLKLSMCRPFHEDPAPTTIYIVVPPEYLAAYRPVLRLMIGLAIVELTREVSWKHLVRFGWRLRPPCPVLFMLDELPALGRMDPILNGLSYLAGYDVRIWSFVQNIGQLKDIYRNSWENFPANAAVTSFFGVNDFETADFVSKLLGKTEEFERVLFNRSINESANEGNSFSTDTGNSGSSSNKSKGEATAENRQLVREDLASAAEVRATPKDLQYIIMRNRKPILATRIDHFNFPLFDRQYGTWRDNHEG